MDFQPDISERIDTLTKKCQEKKKIISDFIGLLQTRAELEEYYSRGLEKIAESLTKLIHGKDNLKELFITLRSFMHIQTEQTRGFARQIKNDIVTEIDNFMNNEVAWQKEMGNIQKKHQKEIRKNIDTLNQYRDDYISAIQEEKRFQANQTNQKKLNYLQSELKLQNYISYYNQYIDNYFQDIAQVQTVFEELELSRRQMVQEGAMKFLMFEISVIKNFQYDLNGVAAKIEQYNPKQDIGELFKDIPNDRPLLCKLNFDNYKQFLHQQLNFKIPKQNQSTKLEQVSDSNNQQQDQQQQQQNQQSVLKKKKPIFDTDPTYKKVDNIQLQGPISAVYTTSSVDEEALQ